MCLGWPPSSELGGLGLGRDARVARGPRRRVGRAGRAGGRLCLAARTPRPVCMACAPRPPQPADGCNGLQRRRPALSRSASTPAPPCLAAQPCGTGRAPAASRPWPTRRPPPRHAAATAHPLLPWRTPLLEGGSPRDDALGWHDDDEREEDGGGARGVPGTGAGKGGFGRASPDGARSPCRGHCRCRCHCRGPCRSLYRGPGRCPCTDTRGRGRRRCGHLAPGTAPSLPTAEELAARRQALAERGPFCGDPLQRMGSALAGYRRTHLKSGRHSSLPRRALAGPSAPHCGWAAPGSPAA